MRAVIINPTMDHDVLEDDFMIIEDLDVVDQSAIRRIIAEVEATASAEQQGLRVSVLTAEQWQTVVQRMLPASTRRGAELYMHLLADPREELHLLVSPSAVKGVNEGSRHMLAEVVYTTLRTLPSNLTRPLRRGADDLLAAEVARRTEIDIYTGNYHREALIVQSLMSALQQEHGYEVLDWVVVFRRTPERVFKALKKSSLQVDEHFQQLLTADPIDFQQPEIINLLQSGPKK
jgi:hypothetical protein